MRSSGARNDAPGFGQTIPAVSKEFCWTNAQRNSMIRMIRGIGIPTSQRRMGIRRSFQVRSSNRLATNFRAPCPIAESAAFGRGETCAERTDQERGRKPEGELRCRLAGSICVGFCLVNDLVDALVGFGLAETSSRSDDLGNVFAVCRFEIASVTEAALEHPHEFTARVGRVTGVWRRRCIRSQKRIDVAVHWSGLACGG